MTWQRSGNLARSPREKGVTSIVIGDLSEEWYLRDRTRRSGTTCGTIRA